MKIRHMGELWVSQIGPTAGPGWMHGVFIEATPDELRPLAYILDRPVRVVVDKAAELDEMLTLRCQRCGTDAQGDYDDGDNCPACGERGALRYRP